MPPARPRWSRSIKRVTGLQRGEADLALAGGVHAILSGRLLEMRANAGMLSPDGRCATFDAAANGYVRGEGCGIVVLKRLAEAEADGDRIWDVVRGSALNQDGASPGLTAPSGPAQEKVIEAALKRAGLQPADVDYVEAHGTGDDSARGSPTARPLPRSDRCSGRFAIGAARPRAGRGPYSLRAAIVCDLVGVDGENVSEGQVVPRHSASFL